VADSGSGVIAEDVPALRKGLTVLESLANDGPATLSELQQRSGLNRTMAFRIARTLRERGYLRHDPVSHRFALSFKLLELGRAATEQLDVVAAAQPHLDDLQMEFGETTNLGVLEDGHAVYVAMAESSRRGLRMASHIGGRDHLHSTSIGKAMLAFMDARARDEVLSTIERPAVTSHTIVDLHLLLAELDATRQRGYAIDNQENEIGARCVGVPILNASGTPFAAISISGPVGRVGDDLLPTMAERLWTASREISRRLGHDLLTIVTAAGGGQ
jgi:IclR family transcriptional regulator, KDG regulon repressor